MSLDNERFGKDTIDMLGEIILIEHRLNNSSEQEFLDYMASAKIGRELLNRGFIKFFSSPQSINKRVKVYLVRKMKELEQTLPESKGANFDARYRELLESLVFI